MLGQNTCLGVFTFHSSACSVILNAFCISLRWRTNLSVSLWGFTSFLRIPSVFWNTSLVFALCTANHPSAFCLRGHFPQKVCGSWGRRKGGKPLFCQSCGCCCCSLFSLEQFSQVMLTNLGCNSWRLLMSHFLEQLFWILPFKRAFSKPFTSEGDSVLC